LREWTDKQKKEPSTQKNSTTPEIDLCSPIEAVEKLLSKIEELEK
jgi:hypothetical protein